MRTVRCPACPHGQRHPRHYLCRTCWGTLPSTTRARLNKRDTRAAERLRELHQALTHKTPLAIIRVTP